MNRHILTALLFLPLLMAAQIDTGSSTAGKANVDSGFNLKVDLDDEDLTAGFCTMTSEVDDGTALGVRTMRSPEVTPDFRLRVGTDTPLLDLSFEGTNVATSIFSQALSGMTVAQAGGYFTLNSGNATAATNRAIIQTYRTVPLFGSFPTYAEFWLREANQNATNAISEWGVGYVSAVAAPTDGVMFRRASGGQLFGVMNFAGTETITAALNTAGVQGRDGVGVYDPTETNHYVVAINNDTAEFWINDTLVGNVAVPSIQGSPMSSSAQPLFARAYVPTGLTASAGRRVEIGYMSASLGDANMNQSFWMTSAAMGRGAYQTQPGSVIAQTTNWANSAAPATATLSNTAASYTTFGGQWRIAAVAGAETDYALFGFQVPAGSSTIAGRTLHIIGVRIGETVNEVVAVATTPTVFQWAIAVGSTNVSLATTDGVATVSPKRKPLGSQSFVVGAAVGQIAGGFDNDIGMAAPAGTFVHIILKVPVGTATATETFRGTVSIDGYYL